MRIRDFGWDFICFLFHDQKELDNVLWCFWKISLCSVDILQKILPLQSFSSWYSYRKIPNVGNIHNFKSTSRLGSGTIQEVLEYPITICNNQSIWNPLIWDSSCSSPLSWFVESIDRSVKMCFEHFCIEHRKRASEASEACLPLLASERLVAASGGKGLILELILN